MCNKTVWDLCVYWQICECKTRNRFLPLHEVTTKTSSGASLRTLATLLSKMSVRDNNFGLNSNGPKAAAAKVAAKITFRCFPKLPIELRLQIWRNSFPPSRQIDINPFPAAIISTSQLGSPPLPTTLYVCHESRTETLRYYCVLFRQDFHYCYYGLDRVPALANKPRPVEIPICFDASTDSLYLPGGSLTESIMDWVTYLSARIPGGMKAIRHLQINEIHEEHFRNQPPVIGLSGLGYEYFHWMKLFLPEFEGLEQLIFTLRDETGDRRLLLNDNQEFKERVSLMTDGVAPGRDCAEYLGFKQSSPKSILFRPFRPITVYTYGNKGLDSTNSMQ